MDPAGDRTQFFELGNCVLHLQLGDSAAQDGVVGQIHNDVERGAGRKSGVWARGDLFWNCVSRLGMARSPEVVGDGGAQARVRLARVLVQCGS